jgi:hypothetical protein
MECRSFEMRASSRAVADAAVDMFDLLRLLYG